MHLAASGLNADIVSKRAPVEFEANPVRRIAVEYYYSCTRISEKINYQVVFLVIYILDETVRAIALADIERQNAVKVRVTG